MSQGASLATYSVPVCPNTKFNGALSQITMDGEETTEPEILFEEVELLREELEEEYLDPRVFSRVGGLDPASLCELFKIPDSLIVINEEREKRESLNPIFHQQPASA